MNGKPHALAYRAECEYHPVQCCVVARLIPVAGLEILELTASHHRVLMAPLYDGRFALMRHMAAGRSAYFDQRLWQLPAVRFEPVLGENVEPSMEIDSDGDGGADDCNGDDEVDPIEALLAEADQLNPDDGDDDDVIDDDDDEDYSE